MWAEKDEASAEREERVHVEFRKKKRTAKPYTKPSVKHYITFRRQWYSGREVV